MGQKTSSFLSLHFFSPPTSFPSFSTVPSSRLATVLTAVCATQTGRLDILSPGSMPCYLCQATYSTVCL